MQSSVGSKLLKRQYLLERALSEQQMEVQQREIAQKEINDYKKTIAKLLPKVGKQINLVAKINMYSLPNLAPQFVEEIYTVIEAALKRKQQ